MSRHKFAVGQVVNYVHGPGDVHVPPGKYNIQRLLPSDANGNQYRVKHSADGHERVVQESKLAPVSGGLG